jgi:RHS repeat-associated protein
MKTLFTLDSEGEIDERFAETESDLYFYRGFKRYEMVNHLNSVLVVISDKRTAVCDQELGVSYFEAEILAAYDYAPFGMMLPERTWSSDSVSYRYSFQSQERDDEIYGFGNSYTAEYWQYDSKLGRRWNNDPRPNPSISVYACFGNNPIFFSDILGDTLRGFDEVEQKALENFEKRVNQQVVKYKNKVQELNKQLENKELSKREIRKTKKELEIAEGELSQWQ